MSARVWRGAAELEAWLRPLAELSPRFCDGIRRRWTAWAAGAGADPGPGALA